LGCWPPPRTPATLARDSGGPSLDQGLAALVGDLYCSPYLRDYTVRRPCTLQGWLAAHSAATNTTGETLTWTHTSTGGMTAEGSTHVLEHALALLNHQAHAAA
jgi:hypothetical protein